MMKKFGFKTTGTTLIELIMAVILVSVVFFGLASISFVLFNNRDDYRTRFTLASQTQATLNQILNDAALAVGTNITDTYGNVDTGILYGGSLLHNGDSLGTTDICIHQGPPGYFDANAKVMVYNNSTWKCYTWWPKVSSSYPLQIASCSWNYSQAVGLNNPSNFGAQSCAYASTVQFVGTAYSMTTTGLNNSVFSLTIQNCAQNNLTTCISGGTTDQVNNPVVIKSGSVAVLQQGP